MVGVVGVLVNVLGVLVGVLGVLVGVLGVLAGVFLLGWHKWCFSLHILLIRMAHLVGVLVAVLAVFFVGMVYLMSLVFGTVYLLHEMEYLIFGMNIL